MEQLLILAGLSLISAALVSAVLGVAAWFRVRALERRVDALQRALRDAAPVAPRSVPSFLGQAPSPATGPAPAPAPPAAAASRPDLPTTVEAPAQPVLAARAAEPSTAGAHEARPAPAMPPTAERAEAPPPPRSAPRPPAPRVDWERWIGVRGAAVVGAVVLAIAGFLFLQYSIERGLITPRMRVILGASVGIACILAATSLRRHRYVVLANSLAGAGAVILYAAAWAAHVLYGMIPFPAAFAAMVAITGLCGLLSLRHESQLIAVLGLAGGFATPLVLSTGQDRPLGLFGYVLLLDLGFLFLAHKRRWPSLGLVALLGTFLIQALWIFARLDAGRLWLGLLILGVFALVFAVWSARASGSETLRGRIAQAGALLLPFAFALYFAQAADLGRELWPTACLAVLLSLAAGWMSRAQAAPWLTYGTASGSIGLCLTWALSHPIAPGDAAPWELALCLLAIAAAHYVFLEWRPAAGTMAAAFGGPSLAVLGGLVVLAVFALRTGDAPWPFLAAGAVLGLLAQRTAALGASGWIALAGGVLAGIVPLVWSARAAPASQAPFEWAGALALQGAAFLVAARLRSDLERPRAFLGAAACTTLALPALVESGVLAPAHPTVQLGACLALGLLIALAATGARNPWVLALAAGATCWAQSVAGALDRVAWSLHGAGWIGFALVALSGAAFAAWPFVRRAAWSGNAHAWRVAALASLPWAWVLTDTLDDLRGRAASWAGAAVFALIHGGIAAWAAARAQPVQGRDADDARIARTWHAAVALLWAAWIPALLGDVAPRAGVAMALWGAGLAWIARRFDHQHLRAVAIAAVAAATGIVGSQLFGRHDRSEWVLSGSIAWLCFVPAGALLAAARWLSPRGSGSASPAVFAGACALLLGLVGLNLEIAHAWAEEPRFRFELGGNQARDLVTSLAWVLYALALLVWGVRSAASAPRWASLVLLVGTIGKVFLVDLGNLTGLYRVGAMLGLALSLIAVSLLYQRFVFRKPE